MIQPLPSILKGIEFSEPVWEAASAVLQCPVVILSPDSKGKEEALRILGQKHYSNSYRIFNYDSIREDSPVSSDGLASVLGISEFKKLRTSVLFLLENSRPIKDSVNGVFVLIRPKGLETRKHVHTFDVLYGAGPQRVFWWNRDQKLGNFWFQQDGQPQSSWPQELSSSNYYELDTKAPHGGDAVDQTTIFFITICRDFR